MPTHRVKEIKPFIVMEVLEKAHSMALQGIDIIHLEVGEPDFDTLDCVKQAACKALDRGHTHYTHSLGILELREAFSQPGKLFLVIGWRAMGASTVKSRLPIFPHANA